MCLIKQLHLRRCAHKRHKGVQVLSRELHALAEGKDVDIHIIWQQATTEVRRGREPLVREAFGVGYGASAGAREVGGGGGGCRDGRVVRVRRALRGRW